MAWKTTYKEVFLQNFLGNLDPIGNESIQNCKKKIKQYIVYEINNQVVGFARFGLNKKIMEMTMERFMLYI